MRLGEGKLLVRSSMIEKSGVMPKMDSRSFWDGIENRYVNAGTDTVLAGFE